jgi:DNA-binding NtrC family response regulator
MVYGIVKSHGGHIVCSSKVDVGTTFRIYLPALEKPVPFAEADKTETLKRGTETILLVDDEEIIRDVGKTMLTKFGYTVLTVPSGESAVKIYRKERERINLVLLDLIMPGMDGQGCLEALLKLDPKTKVIVASGYWDTGPIKEVMETGAKSFIGKPYDMMKLLKLVREVLDAD